MKSSHNKLPKLRYFWRFLRCPSRWYCYHAGRVECELCNCFLSPIRSGKNST